MLELSLGVKDDLVTRGRKGRRGRQQDTGATQSGLAITHTGNLETRTWRNKTRQDRCCQNKTGNTEQTHITKTNSGIQVIICDLGDVLTEETRFLGHEILKRKHCV